MIQLASSYGRYGYRKVTALLREEGWWVNHKRIERLWRQEGLKVPQKQPKRRRLWLNDGSCVRLRPAHKDHVWSYDFVADRTSDGRAFRMLTLIDEHTRECLAIDVARKLKSEDVLERLSDLLVRRGVPKYIRSRPTPTQAALVCPVGAAVRSLRRGRCVSGSPSRRENFVHRTGQSVGERLLRELQRQAPRRALGPRAIRHALGGQGAHRALAAALQHGEAPWIPGRSTPSPRGDPATSLRSGYASTK